MINAVLTGLMVKGDCVRVAKRRNVGAIAAVLVVILAAVPLVLHSLERARSAPDAAAARRSEEHTCELQSLMRISYAVFCLNIKKQSMYNNMKHGYYLC